MSTLCIKARARVAPDADIFRGSSRVPSPPLNRKINSFPIVRKYQLGITCRLSEIQSALLKSKC